jgi:intracellular sulfur oxidation DsrE/DsrF family protein
MNNKPTTPVTHRRGFLGTLAAGAASLGFTAFINPIKAVAAPVAAPGNSPAELWINKINGTHKMVFDATQPHDVFPFAWPRVFLMTNEMTGAAASECCAVVVLRHSAIGYAMDHKLWKEYNLGELFSAEDHLTKAKATRNPFWQPAAGEYKVPGIGEVAIGINHLQEAGVMFCVCETAMKVYSAVVADKTGKKHEDVLNAWKGGLLPGIQPVPSGVWAIGRAQAKGCGYVFTG